MTLESLLGKPVLIRLVGISTPIRGVLTAEDTRQRPSSSIHEGAPRTITLDDNLLVNWANVATLQAAT